MAIAGKSPFWIGNTSSSGCFSIVMLVFLGCKSQLVRTFVGFCKLLNDDDLVMMVVWFALSVLLSDSTRWWENGRFRQIEYLLLKLPWQWSLSNILIDVRFERGTIHVSPEIKHVRLEISSFRWNLNNELLWSKTILQTLLETQKPHIFGISEGSANQSQPKSSTCSSLLNHSQRWMVCSNSHWIYIGEWWILWQYRTRRTWNDMTWNEMNLCQQSAHTSKGQTMLDRRNQSLFKQQRLKKFYQEISPLSFQTTFSFLAFCISTNLQQFSGFRCLLGFTGVFYPHHRVPRHFSRPYKTLWI